jgi:hypothetical protein
MEKLIKRAEEKGIDVEELILSALSRVDLKESIKFRIELAEKYMAEAFKYLDKGDAVQASEKAYKAAEEVVKALSEKFNLPEYQRAVKEGRWYNYMLSKASSTLSTKLGYWVLDGWSSAYFLHVWGFHEAKLTTSDNTSYLNRVKEMLEEAKRVLNEK